MFAPGGLDLRAAALDGVSTLCDWWARSAAAVAYWLAARGRFGLDRRPLAVGTPRNPWEVHFVGAASEAARRRAAALFAAGCPTAREFCAEFGPATEVRAVLVPARAWALDRVVAATITIEGTRGGAAAADGGPALTITWRGAGGAGAEETTLVFSGGCSAGMVFARAIAQKRG